MARGATYSSESYVYDDASNLTSKTADGGFAPDLRRNRSVYGNTSFHSASTLKELHQDYLGSNVLVTDASQNVLLARTFDAFGNRLSTSSNTTLYADWNGSWGYYRQRDSALMLVGHRFYDPSTGRFLTRDPAMDGRNWYTYCDNNPTKWVDPTGCDAVAIGIGLTFGDPEPIGKAIGIGILVVVGVAVLWTAGSAILSEYKEHSTNKSRGRRDKHQEGTSRKNKDEKRKEKGDKRRPY